MLLNGHPGGFGSFMGGCDLHRNYGVVIILLSFLCYYDNLKLLQGKYYYHDEGWLFIGIFKVGSVLGMSVVLEASKKSIKIHYEYDVRPFKNSYNSY